MAQKVESKVIRFPQYDFKEFSAAQGRNKIHDYPAMLHSYLVSELLDEFLKTNQDIVFDPFCGSGTTIVESLKKGVRVHGTDINPLALLIAEVRATTIDKDLLTQNLEHFKSSYEDLTPELPENATNIDYWFKPSVKTSLGKIRSFVKKIEDQRIKNFTLACLSRVARYVSNNRNGEFKRYRLPKNKLDSFFPEVISKFISTYKKYSEIIYTEKLDGDNYQLHLANTTNTIPFEDGIDLVITSPPYGDSRTTVAYGQFSSFGLDWIRGLNPFGDEDLKLDRKCLGGGITETKENSSSNTLEETLEQIRLKDEERAGEVELFFNDLKLSSKNIFEKVNQGGTLCYIVGNRTVKGINIPMDMIVKEQFESIGATYKETRIRNISSKRMPSKNSPTNIAGKKSPTMAEEFILIFDK